MLPVGWLIAAVVVAVLITSWVTFTATRLDRLHARCDAAWAALDAQLVRRAAAVQHAAEQADGLDPDRRTAAVEAATAALHEADPARRQTGENAVGRALSALVDDQHLVADDRPELADTANRVMIARRFYNDAVRDTRSLRGRRMPRWLHLAGHRAEPQFFDIDDTVPPPPATPVAAVREQASEG